jgi:hypothetical protein
MSPFEPFGQKGDGMSALCPSMSAEERDQSHPIRKTVKEKPRQWESAERPGTWLHRFNRLARA